NSCRAIDATGRPRRAIPNLDPTAPSADHNSGRRDRPRRSPNYSGAALTTKLSNRTISSFGYLLLRQERCFVLPRDLPASMRSFARYADLTCPVTRRLISRHGG